MYSRIQKRLKQLGYLEASTDENMAGMLRGRHDLEEMLTGLDTPAEEVYKGWVRAAKVGMLRGSINPRLLEEIT